jgi:hypothetical protein
MISKAADFLRFRASSPDPENNHSNPPLALAMRLRFGKRFVVLCWLRLTYKYCSSPKVNVTGGGWAYVGTSTYYRSFLN